MKYVGSKNRIAKHIIPFIQKELIGKDLYIEPFVGGANMIDKVNFGKKIGSDINEYLIDLLKYVQCLDNELPKEITEDEYNRVKNNKESYEKWYVALVGFCATFGAKWFGGYARGFKADKVTPRNIPEESIKNLQNQRVNLKGIDFKHGSYEMYSDVKNALIYCDIPYKSTLSYKDKFEHDKFYDWCKKLVKNNNTILISEYNMPDEFECIFEFKTKVGIDKKSHSERTEKLFILK